MRSKDTMTIEKRHLCIELAVTADIKSSLCARGEWPCAVGVSVSGLEGLAVSVPASRCRDGVVEQSRCGRFC